MKTTIVGFTRAEILQLLEALETHNPWGQCEGLWEKLWRAQQRLASKEVGA